MSYNDTSSWVRENIAIDMTHRSIKSQKVLSCGVLIAWISKAMSDKPV